MYAIRSYYGYTAEGRPEGMIHGKRMVVVTSRGGDYSESSPFHSYDFQEPGARIGIRCRVGGRRGDRNRVCPIARAKRNNFV